MIISMAATTAAYSQATLGTGNGTAGGSWSGTQLQGWVSVTTPSGSGSFNAGPITDMGNGSWSLWSESAQSEARWDFVGGNLTPGQRFSLDWKNLNISSNRTVTLSIKRSDGSEAFGFRFLGGGTNYEIKGDGTWFTQNASTANYTNVALTLKFDYLSVNNYSFSVTQKSNSSLKIQTGNFTLGGTSGLNLRGFEIYNDAQVAGTSDLNINTITVIPEPTTWALIAMGTCGLIFIGRRRWKSGRLSMESEKMMEEPRN